MTTTLTNGNRETLLAAQLAQAIGTARGAADEMERLRELPADDPRRRLREADALSVINLAREDFDAFEALLDGPAS